MMTPFDPRTPRRPAANDGPRKRSMGIQVGVLGVGLVGGLVGGMGLMSSSRCEAPPKPDSPEALAMVPDDLKKLQDNYDQCRRRRSSTTASRARSRSFFSSNSSRSSISRGGFGRSGSFGG